MLDLQVVSSPTPVTNRRKLLDVWLGRFPATTARAYKTDLRMFERYVGDIEGVLALNPVDLAAATTNWIESMSELSSATRARRLSSVRSFFDFAAGIGAITTNPARHLRGPKVVNAPRDVPSDDDVSRILRVINRSTWNGRRDYCAILWLDQLALRRSELASLRFENIVKDANERTVLKFVGKGGREHELPLSFSALEALRVYRTGPRKKNGAIFVTKTGEPMSANAVYDIVRKHAFNAGVAKEISPHSLRHHAITDAAKAEPSVVALQHFSRHASSSTLRRYIHFQHTDVVEDIQRKRGIV